MNKIAIKGEEKKKNSKILCNNVFSFIPQAKGKTKTEKKRTLQSPVKDDWK